MGVLSTDGSISGDTAAFEVSVSIDAVSKPSEMSVAAGVIASKPKGSSDKGAGMAPSIGGFDLRVADGEAWPSGTVGSATDGVRVVS
ncbi:hypothetical protein NBRC116594_11530 [Shimia sp. NS0008-38b]|uniref:hypothetical protein n=1 Tax=Shimia sp. NS0008-38b TaxID=3127653 RepID=UPI003108EB8A